LFFEALQALFLSASYMHPTMKKDSTKLAKSLKSLARPAGFEPATYGFQVPLLDTYMDTKTINPYAPSIMEIGQLGI
jgi:hypothetical protein